VIDLEQIPPLRGPRPAGVATASRKPPPKQAGTQTGGVSRRSVLRTMVASGTVLGFTALGAFPAARRAYSDGYDIKGLPCPSYAANHECSPGCGPSQVSSVCNSSGWHKTGSSNPWYWTLEPNDCYGGWADGWIWGYYASACAGCAGGVDYRCHDGRTHYCAEQCSSWITICRRVVKCYRV